MSAFIASGPPSRIIEEAVDGNLELILLEPTVIELARILVGKLDFERNRLEETLSLLHDVASNLQASPRHTAESLTGDPDDDLILESAVAAGVEVLVSGDRRHHLPLGEHEGVRILTPQAFLAELRTP